MTQRNDLNRLGKAERAAIFGAGEAALAALRPLAEVVLADIESGPWPLPGRRFDGVVVTNYLWRPLWPHIIASLAVGGVLIYETFAHGHQLIGRDGGATEDPRHVIPETPLELAGQTIGFAKASAEGGFADQTFPVRADPHGGRDGGVAVFEEHRLDAAVANQAGAGVAGAAETQLEAFRVQDTQEQGDEHAVVVAAGEGTTPGGTTGEETAGEGIAALQCPRAACATTPPVQSVFLVSTLAQINPAETFQVSLSQNLFIQPPPRKPFARTTSEL